MLQEFCKLRNVPLFKSKTKAYRRKTKKKVRKSTVRDDAALSTERQQLERHLSQKRSQRMRRHLGRCSPVKRNIINTSLIKKRRRLGTKQVRKSRNPKHQARAAKKMVQRKVVTCKQILATSGRPRRPARYRRSKSVTVEPRIPMQPDLVKLKITSTIQDWLDKTCSRRPTNIVRFREIKEQFGEVIERIKNLKFSAPE